MQPNRTAAGAPFPLLLTVVQAALYLNISAKTLRRRIDARDIPVFRDGGIVRIRRSDLDSYIAGHIGR